MSENLCEAFIKLCDMALALGAAPMTKHVACWEHQVDPQWWVAFNGHKEANQTSNGQAVPPFHCYVEYNGWPAGIITPYGGCIAAGDGANESTFIAALDAAYDQLGAVQPCENCTHLVDNSTADIDAVHAMTARAMACGLLTEVVTAYGDHRASGESAERSAAMALWDWDA